MGTKADIRSALIIPDSERDALREFKTASGVTVYARPHTLSKQKQIQRHFDGDSGVTSEAIAEIVWRFLRDEEGARVFSSKDAEEIMSGGRFHDFTEIAGWIIGKPLTISDHEKNSEGEGSEPQS